MLDSSQLMSEDMHVGVDSFGTGDRAGLARLGAGRCYAYERLPEKAQTGGRAEPTRQP